MSPTARFLIRLGPALIFILHGYLKLLGGFHDQTVALFLTVRIPQPELTAWLIGALEFVGGLALLFGIWVRPFAALFAFEMAVVIYRVRLPQGFLGGWEFELSLLLVCVGLAVAGGDGFTLMKRAPTETSRTTRRGEPSWGGPLSGLRRYWNR